MTNLYCSVATFPSPILLLPQDILPLYQIFTIGFELVVKPPTRHTTFD
jgi:hypothetical protein